MYAPYFGLGREPFSLAPDPRFLFMSERHREALAHLLYGVGGGGGFVLLTGEIGAGKTTVARCFLEQLPAHCDVAYIFNPCLTVIELLQTVCSEFGLPTLGPGASVKAHVDALNAYLLDAHAQGRHALLVIDEAQALEPAVLEQLRLLTNLETAERKLLQIVLIGQPELRLMLAQPGLEQLAQRVIARYHLGPLTAAETREYVAHRLAVAGLNRPLPFDAAALVAIHQHSAGVPRRINLLADRALLGAYAQQRPGVDRGTVQRAAQEVFDPVSKASGWAAGARQPWALWALGAVLLAGVAVTLVGWRAAQQSAEPAAILAATGPAASAAPSASAVQQAASQAPAASLPAPALADAPLPAPAADALAQLMAAAHRDEATAWRELALRWNVSIGEGDPCTAAALAHLACFRSASGGLAQLRLLQRPVMLQLRQGRQTPVFAVLVALDARQARLQVGARSFDLPLITLAGVWRGDFATFWRTPPGWRPGSGVDAAGRVWVQEQLAQAMPESASPSGAAAGTAVRGGPDAVAAFQLLQGLPVDGQAGPLTLMQLNRSAGVEEPRLTLPPER